ncbi:hypothetical protein ACJIZ3_016603 [Penstemon smallii]|uniref:Polygalacturonase n=1 Tax=Penstemon smallii TaxID=265156 RepID=A0ABD3STX0_9LAMI
MATSWVSIEASCLVLAIACSMLTINRVESIDPIGAHRSLAGETIFDIRKFGAKSDGRTDNGVMINQAWRAACSSKGPARVLIPLGNFMAGQINFVGPCAGGKKTVQIQGTLLGDPNPSSHASKAWISAQKVDYIDITGGGTINARGENFWKYAKGGGEGVLPVSLEFQTVGNGNLFNVNFLNSMGFHIRVTDSHDVALWGLNIQAPGNSPNTDGIHLSSNKNVRITDSKIGTGDDCISIGHGNYDVFVSKIECGPGHGISVGSLGKRPDETSMGRITIKDCLIRDTTNGARIKTYHGSPVMDASGITFENIIMERVKNPIIIDQNYNSNSKTQPSKVKISDVHFRNIRGSSISPISITLNCSSTVPCQGVELADINLTSFNVPGPLTSKCANVKAYVRGKINLTGLERCF